MQRFAAMSDICNEISKVLDTMFRSEIPSNHHLPALIHRLAEEEDVPLALRVRSRQVLLGRPTHMQAAGSDNKITHQSVAQATFDQAGRQCHHKHMKTCRKGNHGRVACRLCMKAGKCKRTGCVLLKELSNEEAENLARYSNALCWCSVPDDAFLPSETDQDVCNELHEQDNDECWSDGDIDSFTATTVTTATQNDDTGTKTETEAFFCENDGKTISIAFEATPNIPSDLMPETYVLVNMLERSKKPPLIVWETARRQPEEILRPAKEADVALNREQIMEELRKNLDTVREFSSDHELWEQLRVMSDEKLQDFYQKLVDAFKTANQYIASYNPTLSYCTGSHNNSVLLGGDQQAKAATFYLCPYMGKLKFPLQDCLVILQQTLEHVKKFPSVATDSGTDERTSKHILQRCLNRLNLKMELSGTQKEHVLAANVAVKLSKARPTVFFLPTTPRLSNGCRPIAPAQHHQIGAICDRQSRG